MNIKKTVREALLKKRNRKYDYGCVMIGLDTSTEKWNEIQNMVDEDDIYFGDGENGGYGRELNPHVTILFGIHEDVKDKTVEILIDEIKRPELKLKKISAFEEKLFDVLKFDIESSDFHALNKKFKELPHTTEFPNYHPHATICYLKKGTAKKYVKNLSNVEPIEVVSSEVIYSKVDGTEKKYKINEDI